MHPLRAGVAIGLVAATALISVLPGLTNDFASDDAQIILQNSRVQNLLDWRSIVLAPYWPPPAAQDLYRPLTSLVLALQYALGGGAPLVFRLTSYVVYALTCVVFLQFARRLLSPIAGVCAGLLFAAHAVHAEAVALAVGQAELMTATLAMVAVGRYVDARRAGWPALRDWTIVSIAYAAAILSKEQGYVIPALLLAAELLLFTASAKLRLRLLGPGYGALVAIATLALIVRRAILGELRGSFVAPALDGLNAVDRALTMLRVVPHWVRLLLWPAHLQIDYSPQEIVRSTGLGGTEAFGLAIIGMAAVLCLAMRKRSPTAAFALAWCAIGLAPVSNVFVPTGIVLAERTMFLPSVGVLLAVGALVGTISEQVRGKGGVRLLYGAIGVVVMLGCVRGMRRQHDWRDEWLLSVRSVKDAPTSYRTQQAYANTLFEISQAAMGAAAYRRAVELAPESVRWQVHNNFARSLRGDSATNLEIEQLLASLTLRQDQPDTRAYLIAAYLRVGKYREAIAVADETLERRPVEMFRQLRALADSADRAHAPPGSVRIGIHLDATRALANR